MKSDRGSAVDWPGKALWVLIADQDWKEVSTRP